MIVCGIATLKEREDSFRRAIDSIYGQVDKVIACLNYYSEIPKWAWDYPKMECWLGSNIAGASGKYLRVSQCKGYYLSIDDDLEYPSNWVEFILKGIDKYHCIVTTHGKRYDNTPTTSYRRDLTTNIRCLGGLLSDTEVHVGGTGAMGFHTDDFKLHIFDFKYPNKVDVEVAREAHRQGVKIMCLAHRSDMLKYMKPEGGTIWQKEVDDTIQTAIVNEFLSDTKAI